MLGGYLCMPLTVYLDLVNGKSLECTAMHIRLQVPRQTLSVVSGIALGIPVAAENSSERMDLFSIEALRKWCDQQCD